MNVRHRALCTLQRVAVGVLVVAAVLAALAAVPSWRSPVAAGSHTPDSTTVDRLTRSYFEQQEPSRAAALAPTTGQKAAILAAELLLTPIFYYSDLPFLTK